MNSSRNPCPTALIVRGVSRREFAKSHDDLVGRKRSTMRA